MSAVFFTSYEITWLPTFAKIMTGMTVPILVGLFFSRWLNKKAEIKLEKTNAEIREIRELETQRQLAKMREETENVKY